MISRYRWRRFLAPTAGIRSALLTCAVGLLIFLVGFAISFKALIQPLIQETSGVWRDFLGRFIGREDLDTANHVLGGGFLILGFYFAYAGGRMVLQRVGEILNPSLRGKIGDEFRRRQALAQGPRIVALGGGTGLSTLLRGLKNYSSNITAIVTVTDDGGSSGRLVQEMGIIPPGDMRNCLVALADAEKLMTDLFQHRFDKDAGSLSGHSIGNLLIAALVRQSDGDFEQALKRASEVLAIRGRVVPSTLSHVRLRALMEDGSEVCGETKIVESGRKISRIFLDPDEAEPHPEALEAIRDADLIVIGPGSVYTSIIPNLLVPGVAEALSEASAIKAYVCNVMTQPGESDSFTASEHLVALQANVEHRVCDFVLVNTGVPSQTAIEKYRESGQHLVVADEDRIRGMGYKVVTGNLMSESDYVRHDPAHVAPILMDLLER
ncbi:MAG TPA: YvcK family protein [Fimbriimonadaceae bacterium]|nr:YvcK family protein [Fimbriimonadaceae bacterium]HRJ95949.1 YvcK family protein [Fimbriimonadaceae bacterium]